MTEEEVQAADEEGPGAALMGRGGIALIAGYLVVMVALVLYSLTSLWPPSRPKEIRDDLIAEAKNVSDTKEAAAKKEAEEKVEAERKSKEAEAAKLQPVSQKPSSSNGVQPAAQPAVQVTTPSPTPAASQAPTITQGQGTTQTTATEPDSKNQVAIKEGFCLDERGKPRLAVGAARFLGRPFCMYDEDRLLLIVLLCGALGALVHGLRSLSWYVGNREAVWSWGAMYLLLPFLGSALSFIFYLVIRGGFFSPSSSAGESASPFGFAAMSALIGMFSEPAVNKLRKVAFTIFEPPEKGKDHVGPAPKITGISPAQGSTKGGDVVTLAGTDFSGAVKVLFGGAEAKVLSSSETSAIVQTPAHEPGKVDVVITNGDGQDNTAKEAFEYIEPPPPDNPAGGQPGNDPNAGQPGN
jgi:hypothetical protein